MSLRAVSGIGTTLRRLSLGKALSKASLNLGANLEFPMTIYFHQLEAAPVQEFEQWHHLRRGSGQMICSC